MYLLVIVVIHRTKKVLRCCNPGMLLGGGKGGGGGNSSVGFIAAMEGLLLVKSNGKDVCFSVHCFICLVT